MKRPHILLIVTDQQRGDCLSLDGHPVLATPNMDEVGGSGALFRHAYSEVPSCIPARRILLSGQNQNHTGMVGYHECEPWEPPQTLPGELVKAGYQTHLVGKLHLHPSRKRYGFQSMAWSDGPYTNMAPSRYAYEDDYAAFLRRNGLQAPFAGTADGLSVNGWPSRPWPWEERFHFTHWCVDEAIEFLVRRDPTQPFFLNLSIFAPHPPLNPPALYYQRYLDADLPKPVVGDWVQTDRIPCTGKSGPSTEAGYVRMDPQTLRRCRAGYYGLINHIDDQLGRLFQTLRFLGLFQDTVILITSDHGEMLGDHHMFRKTYAYEPSARVPFLLRVPRWMECGAGLRLDPVVGLQDVTPTLLEAAGAPIPEGVDGRSVLPWMRGGTPRWRAFLHGEHAPCYRKDDGVQYLTDGREKFIWYTQTGEEQFFDLHKDPQETCNLIRSPEYRTRIETWRQRLIQELKKRPEGFTDGRRLRSGRPHGFMIPGFESAATAAASSQRSKNAPKKPRKNKS